MSHIALYGRINLEICDRSEVRYYKAVRNFNKKSIKRTSAWLKYERSTSKVKSLVGTIDNYTIIVPYYCQGIRVETLAKSDC